MVKGKNEFGSHLVPGRRCDIIFYCSNFLVAKISVYLLWFVLLEHWNKGFIAIEQNFMTFGRNLREGHYG